MPRGKNRGLLIAALVFLLLGAGLFFPVPMPEISLAAEKVGSIGGLPLTNTIIATWVTMLVLICLAWGATRRLQEVPSGLQNLFEAILEALLGLVESVAGKRHGRRFFPVVATIFLFVLVSNWLGLFPFYSTLGVVEHSSDHGLTFETAHWGPLEIAYVPLRGASTAQVQHEEGSQAATKESRASEEEGGQVKGVLVPVLRSAATDLNTTLALALVAMTSVQIWGFRALGFKGYGSKFIGLKGGIIGIFLGFMELVGELARVMSFTFRLFGNIFAGEVLLGVVAFLVPWVAVLPFFALELFVGFIQALIFTVLTLVFATMAVAGHGEGAHEEAGSNH